MHEMVMDVLCSPKLVLVLGTDVASSKTLRKKSSFTFCMSDGAVLVGVENNTKSTSTRDTRSVDLKTRHLLSLQNTKA
jgi:3-oxoacyl-[acyl-carrier-protein] synthase III